MLSDSMNRDNVKVDKAMYNPHYLLERTFRSNFKKTKSLVNLEHNQNKLVKSFFLSHFSVRVNLRYCKLPVWNQWKICLSIFMNIKQFYTVLNTVLIVSVMDCLFQKIIQKNLLIIPWLFPFQTNCCYLELTCFDTRKFQCK